VEHAILTARWPDKPSTAIQERAREERYRLLANWAAERKLDAVATAHHLDDQAETFLMRLARGAGVRGLAAMRPRTTLPKSDVALLRPLLGWRRVELEQICATAGIEPARDPSNEDERFERIRIRRALAGANWLNPEALALSAANLAAAEEALEWAVAQEWQHSVSNHGGTILYRPDGAPSEMQRRIVARAVLALAAEGNKNELRGRELDRLVTVLAQGRKATIRGVCCSGGAQWCFAKAPPRKGQDGRTVV
jgi:tRNA(Ile)-lysidine synthase